MNSKKPAKKRRVRTYLAEYYYNDGARSRTIAAIVRATDEKHAKRLLKARWNSCAPSCWTIREIDKSWKGVTYIGS